MNALFTSKIITSDILTGRLTPSHTVMVDVVDMSQYVAAVNYFCETETNGSRLQPSTVIVSTDGKNRSASDTGAVGFTFVNKPSTHRQRRRDSAVELRRVGGVNRIRN